jgi:nicotinamidase/pyrazinamidase
MKSALIIVDIQKDFMPGGALGIVDGDKIIPAINRIIRFFPLVVASKDYHPKNHVSFASSHPKRRPGDVITLAGRQQNLWPEHCIQESLGSEFDPRLDKDDLHHIVLKGTRRDVDSYSTFYDNAREKSTGLHEFLRKNSVKNVFICGVATDFCVFFSVLDAIHLGYNVYVIKDLCKPVNIHPGDDDNCLEKMKNAGARIIDSSDVLSYL